MGKLVDKLQQVSQGGGSGFGFMARASERKPRPAAVLVTLGATDAGGAEAAAKQGVDAVIVTNWTPSTNVSAISKALAGPAIPWGVEIASGSEGENVLKAAHDAGASFVVLAANAPARVLYEEVEQVDRVVTLDLPQSDMDILLLRSQSLLPAQVALVRLTQNAGTLANLSLGEYVKLRMVAESLRFPLLAIVRDTPDAQATTMLARLGIDGIVLSGAGVAAETLGAQVKAVREQLEKTPMRDKGETSVSLNGMLAGSAVAAPHREPEPEHE